MPKPNSAHRSLNGATTVAERSRPRSYDASKEVVELSKRVHRIADPRKATGQWIRGRAPQWPSAPEVE